MVPRFRGCVSGLRRPVSSSRARARRQRARGDVGGAVPTRVRGRDGCGRRCADGRPLLLTRGSDRPQPHSVGWPAVRAGCLSLSSSLPDRAHRWALPMQPRRRAHTELASARDEKERRDGALVAPLVSRDSTGRGSERRPRGPASAFVGQAAAPRGLGRRRPRVCLVALPVTRLALLLRPAADREQKLDLGLFPLATWPVVRGCSSDAEGPSGVETPHARSAPLDRRLFCFDPIACEESASTSSRGDFLPARRGSSE
jgi:hypothetical protein